MTEPEPLTAEEEQGDLYAQPLAAAAAAPAPEPQIVAPVARIVDPSVAEADERDAPLFAEPAYEGRRPRGGFLSLFGGRPRYDSSPAPAPRPAAPLTVSRGGALPMEAIEPEAHADTGEDLEIPSFLRRLAN